MSLQFVKEIMQHHVDPLGEEDWDEYELTKNTPLVLICVSDDGSPFFIDSYVSLIDDNGFVIKTNLMVGDNFKDKVDINFGHFDTNTRQNLEKDKKYLSPLSKSKNLNLIGICAKEYLMRYYGDIMKYTRTHILNTINQKVDEISKKEKSITKNSTELLSVKSSYLDIDMFPNPNEMQLRDNQYVVVIVDSKKDYGSKELYTVSVKVGTMESKVKDGEKIYYIQEGGNKLAYMGETFDKLEKNNYILLKSKRNPSRKTYISKTVEYYELYMTENVIPGNNKNVDLIIEEKHKKFDQVVDEIKEIIKLKDQMRENYKKTNIKQIIKDIIDI